MPTYQYRCAKCGEDFELWQSIHDDALSRHPGCGGTVTRVFAPAGIVLKGSGFYRTDSRAAARKGSDTSKKKEAANDGASSGNGSDGDGTSTSGAKESTGAKDSGSTSGSKDSKGTKDSKDSKSPTSKSGSSST
jgi:putative FmdB family regulatory protein